MTAIDPVTQDVHDKAAAVFSRSFSFVEWTHVIASKTPSGIREGNTLPYRESFPPGTTKGERWIYVFRRWRDIDPFDVVEEIHLSANGNLTATASDNLLKEVAARGKGEALGKTMTLPRRIRGRVQDYRFYCSRVQLPLAQIEALAGVTKKPESPEAISFDKQPLSIDKFAPPVFLHPGKNTSVFEANGRMLVPVVDPITIAQHLHAAYAAAADDVLDYTMPHQGLDATRRERVDRRLKKVLLAQILKGILDQEEKANGNDLIQQIGFSGRGAIDVFIQDYNAQVQSRVNNRDRLAGILTRWQESPALKIAAAAHRKGPRGAWAEFCVPWCSTLARLDQSRQGRDFVRRLVDDNDHFAHGILWPTKRPTDDDIQMVRKSSMTTLEAFKVYAESRIITVRWSASAKEIARKIERLAGFEAGTLEIRAITKSVAGKTFKYEAVAFSASHDVRGEAKALRGLGALIESVNLLFGFRSAADGLKSADPQQRELIMLGLFGSALDAANAIGGVLKVNEKLLSAFGLISGVIDIYLGVEDQKKQIALANQGGADGAFVTAVGATVGTAGTLLAMLAVPGANIIAAIGLAIVASGDVYKVVKGRSPLEILFARCTWGRERKDGKADWSPVDFKEWYGRDGYLYQLQALLGIICEFDVDNGDTYRDLTFKLGWVPIGARLGVTYEETWADIVGSRKVDGYVTFTEKDPKVTGPFRVSKYEPKELRLTVNSPDLPKRSLTRTVNRRTRDGEIFQVILPAEGLRAKVTAFVNIDFDGIAKVSIPIGRDPKTKKFPS